MEVELEVVVTGLVAIGVCLATLVAYSLHDIKKTTKGNDSKINKVVVQVTEINGSVKRNTDRIAAHEKLDDDRDDRYQEDRKRTLDVLDNIWAKVNS